VIIFYIKGTTSDLDDRLTTGYPQ